MKVLDGTAIAKKICCELADAVSNRLQGTRPPGIANILVGSRHDSIIFVQTKKKAAHECGYHVFSVEFAESTSQQVLVDEIIRFNKNPECDGIMVELPLPNHMDVCAILSAIEEKKDVDGLCPCNVGLLHLPGAKPYFFPCAAMAVLEMLDSAKVPICGKRAVVIGAGMVVGRPVAEMLLQRGATVTISHQKTTNIEEVTSSADIIVAATGKCDLVGKSWVQPGATVIDVGCGFKWDTHFSDRPRCAGDVRFDELEGHAAIVSPVPGGVGPVAVAMLLKNTYEAYVRNLASHSP